MRDLRSPARKASGLRSWTTQQLSPDFETCRSRLRPGPNFLKKVPQLMVTSFSRDLRKGLALVRGLALSRKAAADQPESRSSFDVSRFEVPACPPNLQGVGRERLIGWYWRGHPRMHFFQ